MGNDKFDGIIVLLKYTYKFHHATNPVTARNADYFFNAGFCPAKETQCRQHCETHCCLPPGGYCEGETPAGIFEVFFSCEP
jgi:hypothetical protein